MSALLTLGGESRKEQDGIPEEIARTAGHHRFAASAGRSALFFAAFLPAFVAAMLAWGSPARAMPASDEVKTLEQPDGDTFAARQYGDEWSNGYETKSGYTVVQAPQSDEWVYAVEDGGDLEPTSRVAGEDAPPADADRHLRADVAEPNVDYPDPDVAPASMTLQEEGSMGAMGNTGNHNSLVLLAKFSDQENSTTPAQWNSKFFAPTNSVRDYYRQASYGKLNINPAADSSGTVNDGVVGWLTMPYAHPDTASADGGPRSLDPNIKLTVDALKAADPYVNFKAYDTDGNGILYSKELHVTVVAAGQEGSCCNDLGKSVWGHMAAVNDSLVPTLDGVRVGGPGPDNGYTQFGEKHGDNQASIGIMAHELGHDLGLPDLYDIDYSSRGVGDWSVMGTGGHNALPGQPGGSLPALPDAWSRSYEGWTDPVRVEGDVQVPQVATSNAAYQMLHNPAGVDWLGSKRSGTGEYFLVENRQLTGYDAGLPGCGILVWHIDEDRDPHSETNTDDAHRMVDLEDADGGDGYPLEEDAFVGSDGRGVFDDSSDPNSDLYSGAPSGVSMNTTGGCSSSMGASIVDPRSEEAVGSNAFASAPSLSLANNRVSAGGSNSAATKEAGEPNHAGNAGGKSLWYRWTAPENGRLTLNTRGSKPSAGDDMDTTLGMYTGSAVNGLTPVVPGNDDETNEEGNRELATSMLRSVPVNAGTTYRIAVDGRNTGGVVSTGNVALNLSFEAMADPFDPTARITSPTESATLKGANVLFSADVTDNIGVERVEFYVDFELLGTDTTPEGVNGNGYSMNWDSTLARTGFHYFSVVAYDVSGHRVETDFTRAYVDNNPTVPPKVSSSTPAPGKTNVSRKGSVKVNFSETMNVGTLNKYGVKIVREGTTTPLSATIAASADRKSVTLNPYGNTSKLLLKKATYQVILATDEIDGLRDANEGELLQSGGLYQATPDGEQVFFRFTTGTR